jgi:hypothetical protein
MEHEKYPGGIAANGRTAADGPDKRALAWEVERSRDWYTKELNGLRLSTTSTPIRGGE